MDEFTEYEVINGLYVQLFKKNHEPIVPNIRFFEWESDILSVTKSGYLYEYEIKTSRSDFLADANKTFHYSVNGNKKIERQFFDDHDPVDVKEGKTFGTVYRKDQYRKIDALPYLKEGPTCFYYVVPEGTVEPNELPDYAGLIEYRWKEGRYTDGQKYAYYKFRDRKRGFKKPKIKPERLNSRKVTEKEKNKLLRSLFFRYWNERRRERIENQKIKQLKRDKRRAENAADRYKERYEKWMNKYCDLKEQIETQKEG